MTTGLEYLKDFTKENPLPLSFGQWYHSMKRCSLLWHFNYNMKYKKIVFSSDTADRGNRFHEMADSGMTNMKVVDGEVQLISRITPTPDDGKYPAHLPTQELLDKAKVEHKESLEFIEDWMQTKYDKYEALPTVETEVEIKCAPEQIHGIWVQRIGVIDLLIRNPDGTYFIWDFKTGEIIEKNPKSPNVGKSKSKLNRALHQQYYYKGILERNEHVVNGVGLIYPEDRQFFRRLVAKVPRGTKNTSKIRQKTVEDQDIKLEDTIYKLLNEPIQPEFDGFWCNEYCDYANEDTLLCNFEDINLSILRPVSSLIELQILAEELQDDGDDWL